jgi:hypothetical protein
MHRMCLLCATPVTLFIPPQPNDLGPKAIISVEKLKPVEIMTNTARASDNSTCSLMPPPAPDDPITQHLLRIGYRGEPCHAYKLMINMNVKQTTRQGTPDCVRLAALKELIGI